MNCEHCGASIDSTSQFCGQCGSRVGGNATPQRAHSQVSQAKRRSSPKLLLTILILSIPLALVGFIFFRVLPTDDISEARKILAEATQVAVSIENPAAILTQIGSTYAKLGDKAAAVTTFQHAHKPATKLAAMDKISALTNLAAASGEAGEKTILELALKDAFVTVGAQGDELGKGWALHEITTSQIRIGDLTGAHQTAAQVVDAQWKAAILRKIALAQIKLGNREAARLTLSNARRAADGIIDLNERGFITLPYRRQSHALQEIAVAQAKAGALDEALGTTAAIKDLLIRDVAMAEIAGVYAKNRDADTGFDVIARIERKSQKSYGLRLIALAQLEEEKGTMKAIKTARSIQDDFERARVLISIGRAQLKAGNRVEGMAALQEASRSVEAIQNRGNKSKLLLQIITAQVDGGEIGSSVATRIEEVMRGATSDELWWYEGGFFISKELALVQAQTGDVAGALKTANFIPQEDYRVDALQAVAKAQARTGDVKGALAWATKEKSPLLKSSALLGVAEGILERIEAKKAKSTVPKQQN